MTKVLVYGSLKKGFGNHHILENARFLGKAVTSPEFTMLHLGGFPGIVRGGETAITGEVYEVDAATLRRLDRLEGHPNFYRRDVIAVTMEDGTEASTEGYLLPATWLSDGRCASIQSGTWTLGGR